MTVSSASRSSARHKVRLTGAPETLLMTLRAKALDARAARPILGDQTAAEWADAVDYDFGKLAGFGDALIAVRARQIDAWAQEFLRAHPRATVLQLGCGLDTRFYRLAPGPGVLWIDVDVPEVMDLRKRLCDERPGYRMIASSVTDPGLWPLLMALLPPDRRANEPVLVIAEGLFEYLREAEVKQILNEVTARFGSGEVLFDVMNSFAVKGARKSLKETTGAVHQWAVDDPAAVDRLDPRLRRVRALPLFASRYVQRAPASARFVYTLLRFVPPFRTMLRVLQYRF